MPIILERVACRFSEAEGREMLQQLRRMQAEELKATCVVGALKSSVSKLKAPRRLFLAQSQYSGGFWLVGDLFIQENILVYVSFGMPNKSVAGPGRATRYADIVLSQDYTQGFIEVGTLFAEESRPSVRAYVEATKRQVIECVQACVDKRKNRKPLSWKDIVPSLNEPLEDDDARVHAGEADDETIALSIMLQEERVRGELLKLKQSGLTHSKSIDIPQQYHGVVITKRKLVQCRKTSQTLALLSSQDDLNSAPGTTRCPYCSRAFREELITETYCLADEASDLLTSSQWMTNSIVHMLLKLGIREVYAGFELESEEIDICLKHLGETWIFELKDRNFESGDAYALAYRARITDANRVYVVSTKKISTNAQQILLTQLEETNANLIFVEDAFKNEKLANTLRADVAVAEDTFISARFRTYLSFGIMLDN